jgi:amino acid adenylation domain-containing protein/non-ribosomal peptide synthase protein (TIGR01720 family)
MTMHHIVSDGWSSGVLVREIASLYNAFLSGKPSPLERLPVQYADFACWQRQWLQGEVLETQLGYWTKQLGDSPPLLALPADRPRPAYQTDHGGRVLFTLPQGLYAALKSLGDREGATLFMTLLAGFKALLFRYTGQDDISIGTPIANRNRAEIERMIGCFINTLVLRTDLSGDPTFGELLHRVRKASLEAYMHQDLPFEMVVDALKLDRDTSYSPLFQVMFILQNAPMEDLDLAGLKIRPMEVETGVSTFDLTLVIGGDEAGLSGSFEYNSDLFDAATIERMATHFRAVLEGATSDPDRSLSCLPLLRQEEKEVFLDKWGKAEASYPRDACVHHLFEARVALTPDATALVVPAIDGAGCRMMSYRELNRRSNRLAHRLRRVGFGPEKVAGLCVDRTLEMIVGALGILKAGGSFVALDPQYPDERLELILQDARAAVLMVQERHASRLPFSMPAFPCPLLLLDLDPEGIAPGSDDNPSTGVDPGNLAYVVYTSGSTGKPKGVLVRHRNLVNAFFAWQSAYRLCEVRTHLQMAGVAFDVFCGDLVRALCSGGRLVLCPRDFLLQPERLHDLLVDENVECAEFVPAVLRNLAAHLEATGKDLRSMRLILCGSDIWYEKEYKYLLRFMAPQGRLINSFGLAEATVDSSFFEGPELCFPEDRHVPIGRPFANTSLYVLDNHLHPQPIGVTGEIHIGGMGISTGYLNRSDLTGGKFIPDPFSNVPGARLYKTGDMGRYLPDGNVEYLGRSDDQVKIRGFRIELGEVETLLKQHSRVKDVVVTAVDGRGDVGGKRLAAYLVPSEKGVVPSSHELRTFLRERLPDYMVPSAFMVLDELPLTPTGKVNRRALPALTHEPIQESGQIAPRTGEEEILAQIWCDVLGVSRVGVHENFFELGGDSILTVQVVARANQLGFRLTPRHLFELPTVAELALLYGKGCAIRAEQGIVTGPAPLTPIQLWFFEQGLPEPHHWNQTVLLRTRERLKPLQLEKALAHLISHHDALRLRFEHSENGWRQFHASADEKAPFLLIDLSELSDRDQGRAVEEHSTALQASLNLSDGPMLRVALFDLGSARPGRLLIAVHHLVMDGVSWRIFLQDLLTAYGLLSSGKRLKLPPKTTSFQYWSQRLQDRAREEELRKELHHWLRHAGADAARLPLDFPGGENSEKSAETVTVSLGPEETEMLLREVPAAYRTEVNDALLAALLRVVSRWTGSRTVLVELEGHGREDLFDDVDVSRTVGWFTSFYPVNLGLPRADGPGELLKAVKEQLRQAPSKGIGYGLLRYLCPDQQVIERMKSLPQPEIAFNYLGQFDQTLPEDSPFDAAEESQGPDRSLKGRLSHLLEINGGVSKGRLTLEWTYSGNLYRRATIMELAQDYLAALQEIISHCRSPEAGGISPSDFSLARLDQKKLDKIISKVSKKPFHPQRRENISSRAVTSQLVRD